METDLERRRQLRSFLMYQRSRLTPAEVGLPKASRRRVPGLRRQEVAEMIGVSEDWYRWFESGRPINVSPKFLARLADAMRLNAYDRATLYRLSIPDLGRADATVSLEFPPSLASNLATIALPYEIDGAQRAFDAAREAFLTSEPKETFAILRSRILNSWERSRSSNVDASVLRAPLVLATDDSVLEAREENHALIETASPIVSYLQTTLGDLGYAVSIADRAAHVLQLDGDRNARRLVERAGIVPGGDLSEDAVGTNGIGTVVADRRPLQIMASEHFAQGGQPLSCTGAPIRDPRSGAIAGVIVVMGPYELVRPALLPAVIHCALEIEEELAKKSALVALH